MDYADLPDIFGSFFTEIGTTAPSLSGAFEYPKSVTNNAGSTGGFADAYITFNASSCNDIYSNSDMVQLSAIKVRVKTRYI